MKKILLFLITILTFSCNLAEEETQEERKLTKENYSLVFSTQKLDDFVTIYAKSKIVYADSTLSFTSEYNESKRAIVIDLKTNPESITTDFYIEDGSEVNVVLFSSVGDVLDEKVISEINYTYNYKF